MNSDFVLKFQYSTIIASIHPYFASQYQHLSTAACLLCLWHFAQFPRYIMAESICKLLETFMK